MRFRIHPLFIALAVVLVIFGQALAFLWTMAALLLHEAGHAVAARARGYIVKEIVLLPFGAMMSSEENFDKTSSVIIGLAGPAVNLIAGFVTLGVWWLLPSLYPYTRLFFFANISLAVFNLLPAFPLDGSRAALGLAKNRLKTLKRLQICGIAISFIFFALFIASAFFDVAFSLGIMAVFLFYGATSGAKDEMYVSVMDGSAKNYQVGVDSKEVKISAATPIARLYHHISATSETTFFIVDDKGLIIHRLPESALKDIAVKNKLSTPIGDAIEGKTPRAAVQRKRRLRTQDKRFSVSRKTVADTPYFVKRSIRKIYERLFSMRPANK